MGKIIAEVTVVPLGTASTSLSVYVAEVEKVLREFPGLKSLLTPMSTILEGELAKVLTAVQAMHEAPFRMGALRVSTTLRIDDRRDREITMEGKLAAVKRKM
ncbi:MAG: MTH1187 family thiamine-binding protein [Candidatus Aminicenantes bacterium]|nr:MTH1187 family thiamine-binding protein [Candidatus Aminicenantes bacterium]